MNPDENARIEPVMKPVVSETALAWLARGLWALCVVVYLTVFFGAIFAGSDELPAMGRAIGLTLGTGVLGKLALGVIERASLPEEEGPTAELDGPIGSLVEHIASANVAEQEDRAEAA